MIKELSNLEYDNLKNSDETYIIKYYTSWCNICSKLESELLKVDFNIYALDVEKYRDNAVKDNVRGVPTVILFKGKKELKRFVAYKDADAINSWIKGVK
ncbi:MAG: thioredoxin family protein [Acholeplasmatales bacterium]|jgi:thioredoxin-like negative regulator of GroEL|nr:thioredoxin family protein [Acholeplasmatales bacterium]